MKVVILAAGFGNRLRPLTDNAAKPSLPFFDRSLISHLIHQISSFGMEDFAVNLHYKPETLLSKVHSETPENIKYRFFFEKSILGTGGALYPMRDYLSNGPFMIVNGDIVIDIDLSKLLDFHESHGDPVTMVLHRPSYHLGFPGVGFDKDLCITRFPFENGRLGESDDYGTFCGISVCDSRVFRLSPSQGVKSLTQDLFMDILMSGNRIRAFPLDGYWNDLGTPRRYLSAHRDILGGLKGNKGSYWDRYSGNKNNFIGRNCHCDENINLGSGVVLGDNVTVQGSGIITDTVIWPGLRVEFSGSEVSEAIVFDHHKIFRVTDE